MLLQLVIKLHVSRLTKKVGTHLFVKVKTGGLKLKPGLSWTQYVQVSMLEFCQSAPPERNVLDYRYLECSGRDHQ